MNGPGDYHNTGIKSDRVRQIYDITYMQNLKRWYKWTYLEKRDRLTEFENKLMVTKGEKWGRGDKLGDWDWQIHTTIHKTDM